MGFKNATLVLKGANKFAKRATDLYKDFESIKVTHSAIFFLTHN